MAGETDLTDVQWRVLKPLMPPRKHTGQKRADDRQTLNGILYVLRTGSRWSDVPSQYGSPTTCWRRLKQGTKWMLVTDGNGLPLAAHLDSAQIGETTLAETTLKNLRIMHHTGRPRTRPRRLVADKGYDSIAFRQAL